MSVCMCGHDDGGNPATGSTLQHGSSLAVCFPFLSGWVIFVCRFPILESGFWRYSASGDPAAIHCGDYYAGKGGHIPTRYHEIAVPKELLLILVSSHILVW